MSTWNRILDEIERNNNLHNSHIISNLDNIRRKYLTDLYNITKRNVILYYSGWLQQRGVPGTEINDEDINSIVSVMDELPAADGLDIILHTPGGIISSTERLVEILRTVFGHNIRAFIPQIAMSGGTLIAFACKEIYMAKFASIGPIDPQIFIPNVGYVSAISLIEEFDRAFTEIKNDNDKILIWNPILDKYNPSTIINCGKAIELTKNLSVDYLMSGVLSDEDEDISATKSEKITKELIENVKSHDTHISPLYCKNQLLYCHRKFGPLSKTRLWYNIHLLERSIRWRNENEETSPPSLKPKLFLRLSAVKVPKQKCVGDITSAMNNFQSGSDSFLKMRLPSLNPLINSLMPLRSGSPNLSNSLGG